MASLTGLLLLFASMLGADPSVASVPAVEWDAAFDQSNGWIGGDAIYSTPLPGGEVLWLFADTFIGQVKDGTRQPGLKMVNNTLARHKLPAPGTAPDPSQIRFLWHGSHPSNHREKEPTNGEKRAVGEPAAWIKPSAPDREKEWYWVADAISAPDDDGKDRLIVFLWRMARSDGEGIMNFRSAGNNLAIIDNPTEDWSEWEPIQVDITHLKTPSSSDSANPIVVIWGSELLLEEMDGQTYLVIFGYRHREKWGNELVAARVDPAHVEEMDRWEFRSSDGWTKKLSDLVALAEGLTTEYSISKVKTSSGAARVLVQSQLFFGTRILARTAASPFGPWSKPQPIYSIPDIDKKKKHFTYAAKAHPELSPADRLLVSYVVNSFDFGEACRNAEIYRPRFVWVSARMLEE